MLLLLWSPTDARKRLEVEVGHRKGQAGTQAPPSPQVSDRKRPQQPQVFISERRVMGRGKGSRGSTGKQSTGIQPTGSGTKSARVSRVVRPPRGMVGDARCTRAG